MQEDSTVEQPQPATPAGAQPSLWQRLEKNQKIFLVVLACFGLLMFVLWAVQLRKGLFEPLLRPAAPTQQEAAEGTTTAKLDTDGDGLKDDEELGVYYTSPYLEDTDSDGFKDGEELRRGSDPNCPEGRTCTAAPSQTDSQASTTPAQPAAGSPAGAVGATTTASGNPAAVPAQQTLTEDEMKAMLQGQMTAPALRQAMLKAGADPQLLGQLSDEELLKSYQQALKSQ